MVPVDCGCGNEIGIDYHVSVPVSQTGMIVKSVCLLSGAEVALSAVDLKGGEYQSRTELHNLGPFFEWCRLCVPWLTEDDASGSS